MPFKDPEIAKAYHKAYQERHRSRIRQRNKERYAAMSEDEIVAERKRLKERLNDPETKASTYKRQNEWRRNNRDKEWAKKHPEKHAENVKRWQRKNPAKLAAMSRTRQARKMERTPFWLTDDQKKEIETFYLKARERTELEGVTYEVDHIVPLKGRNVSGLHVPWNLQVITASENRRKWTK